MLMSWWHKLFAPKEPTYRDVEVGRAVITVKHKGEQFWLEYIGHFVMVWPGCNGPGFDYCVTGRDKFRDWQERCGKTGMVAIGNNRFLPMCNVDDITVEYFEHQEQVKE